MPISDLYNVARNHDLYKSRKIRLQAQWNLKAQLGQRARLANALLNPPSATRRSRILSNTKLARCRRTLASLEPKSPLDGFLIAAKDNICTNDLPTTCASSILQGFRSLEGAEAVNRLQNQGGALVVVKANMDEFGMGSHSTHSVYGPVQNFIGNAARSAGGSSGGSAMAVATDQCYLALGTDTGGSVRLPAAYTGLAGFKPSYGVISRQGVVPYANSLDTVGIMARSCFDILHTFKILNMPDNSDPTSLARAARRRIGDARKARQRSDSSQGPIKFVSVSKGKLYSPNDFPAWRKKTVPVTEIRWRVGVPTEYNIEEMSDEVREAWVRTLSLLASRGHDIVPISLPTTRQALSAYYVLAPAEASSNLAKYDGVRYGVRSGDYADTTTGGALYSETRGQNFGSEVKRRILLGAYSLSADAMDNYFIQAQKVRRLVQKDFDAVFKMANPIRPAYPTPPDGVDYIVCPTAPTPPPLLEEVRKSTPLDAYVNDVFTVPASLAGLPAISVPAPAAEHVSSVEENFIGMQVIGQYGDDYGVLRFASQQLEVGYDWNALRASAHVRETRRIR